MKTKALCMFIMALGTLGLARTAVAQDVSYRLTFKLTEIQGGKPGTTRSYSMVLEAKNNGASSGRIRMGGSVPVKTGSSGGSAADRASGDSYTYRDIGFSLDCQMTSVVTPNTVPLNLTAAVTSIVPPSQPPLPIFHTASASVQVSVPVGKSVTVATLEDLNADDAYQLDVEVTPVDAAPAGSGH